MTKPPAAVLLVCAACGLGAACTSSPVSPTPTVPLPTPKSTLAAIHVEGTAPEVGHTGQLRAIATLTTGGTVDVTREVEWSTTNPGLLAVDGLGRASATNVGPAIVTASLGDVSATLRLLIEGPGSYLMFESDPGDPVGQGEIGGKVAPAQSILAVRPDLDRINVRFRFQPSSTAPGLHLTGPASHGSVVDWVLNLAGPGGQTLTPGSFGQVTTWPSGPADLPRMRFDIGAHGCALVTGRFEIHELVYAGPQEIHRLRVTFEQSCDGRPAGLRGVAAFNR